MPREIITVNIGGCGVNLGQTLNEQYCVEQGISCDGDKEYKTKYDDKIPILFEETYKSKYFARSLMIDLDPYSINNMKNMYKYNNIFHPEYLISGKSNACYNFAIGHYKKGKKLIDEINETLRMSVEACDNIQGFIINHSLSGGTGAGLGTLIFEQLDINYSKKCKIGFDIFHDEDYLSRSAQIYNTLFSLYWLIDHAEMSIILDNKQMANICRNVLNIKSPRYKNYNYLLNKLISSIIAPSRYEINETLNTMYQDLIPFPRMHFMMTSMSPILPSSKINNNKKIIFDNDLLSLTKQCVENNNFFISSPDFDFEEDKYMSMSFNYRGHKISPYVMAVNKAMSMLKENKKISFVEYANPKPCIKFIDDTPPKLLELDDIINNDKQVTMIANNTCITRFFAKRVCKYYDILYKKRSYFHHFINNGMDQKLFDEARESLSVLETEYLDIDSINDDDNDDEEDEDNDNSDDDDNVD